MSCSCGCVTDSQLSELAQRFERLRAATGFEEAICGGPLKPCSEHAPVVRHDCRKCETYRPACRHDCLRCRGIGTVLVKIGNHEVCGFGRRPGYPGCQMALGHPTNDGPFGGHGV